MSLSSRNASWISGVASALALLVMGLGFAGCPAKQKVVPPCTQSSDCGSGKVCVAGTCVTDGCGGTCANDQICLDGACKTADGVNCLSQPTICPNGFTCTGNGTCGRNCTQDDECTRAGFNICDVDKFTCVQCAVDTDCMDNPNGHTCNKETGACVGCVEDRDCFVNGAPAGQYCDIASHSCQMGCNSLDDCPSGTKSCAPAPSSTTGVSQCIECTPATETTDCVVPGLVACDAARLRCVQCNVDNDCATLNTLPPYCETHRHQCVICTDNSACPMGQICDQSSFSCVDGCAGGSGGPNCPPNTVCKPPTPGTSGNGTCVACLQTSDCPQGDICVMQNGAPACVEGCVTDDNCPVNRVCDPSRGANGQCVGCIRNEDCAAQGLICDTQSEECRCKKEGEDCSADSECGYRLIPSPDGGFVADCHAQGARCLTEVRCGPNGSTCSPQVRPVTNVCVVLGQGLADQCTPDGTGCPAGFVNEFGHGVSDSTWTKLCVPSTNACLYPWCGNGCR